MCQSLGKGDGPSFVTHKNSKSNTSAHFLSNSPAPLLPTQTSLACIITCDCVCVRKAIAKMVLNAEHFALTIKIQSELHCFIIYCREDVLGNHTMRSFYHDVVLLQVRLWPFCAVALHDLWLGDTHLRSFVSIYYLLMVTFTPLSNSHIMSIWCIFISLLELFYCIWFRW